MPSYNAVIELLGRFTPRRVDAILDALAGHGPAISPAGTGVELTITLEAENLQMAALRALQLAGEQGNPATLTVMSTAEFDRRVDAIDSDRLIDTGEVARLLGVSPQRVRQLNAAGRFGTPQKVGNALAWPEHIIRAYAAARTEE